MARFRANTTIGYAHGKEMIPALAVFDPASLELADAIVAQMHSNKLITSVGNDEPITFGPAPAEKVKNEKTARPNANDAIKLVEAAESLEALNALAEGEERVTVVAAIKLKRQALTPTE